MRSSSDSGSEDSDSEFEDMGSKAATKKKNGGENKSEQPPKFFVKLNDRWEVCISASDGVPKQVSFVNSICTVKGGQHVNYIADQVKICCIF